MNNQKQHSNKPLSLSCFNQCNQQILNDYFNTYSSIQKKQRQNEEKQKKVNFFMEEEEFQNFQNQENIFTNNFSIPSISFIDFKDAQQNIPIGSIQGVSSVQNLSFEDIQLKQQAQKFKFQQVKKQSIKKLTNDKKYEQKDGLKLKEQIQIKFGLQSTVQKQCRVKQILQQATQIKEELQNTLAYFVKTIAM